LPTCSYPHGVPNADTAAIVADLHDDGTVAARTFYVQDPLFP
jgi:hypothetical protein